MVTCELGSRKSPSVDATEASTSRHRSSIPPTHGSRMLQARPDLPSSPLTDRKHSARSQNVAGTLRVPSAFANWAEFFAPTAHGVCLLLWRNAVLRRSLTRSVSFDVALFFAASRLIAGSFSSVDPGQISATTGRGSSCCRVTYHQEPPAVRAGAGAQE